MIHLLKIRQTINTKIKTLDTVSHYKLKNVYGVRRVEATIHLQLTSASL
jgi:hypothetical protein